ncbi:T9SS type A sorting domain-containing protein [Psychroflexus sediminis]|uniref:Por secretion system C-terminal sorting domain-containing protein n=1 Tax=Psychroflexus sediminis TaxID=470826 RepID=A0A1G7TSZ7_9FLAO|nr:T9SS type A sorting domain-containing protein [Psychroflexus sediminis]SDG38332.1 Por secretion system C-terminal sorting domain-containing protein [Psychroflexus sediminis]
MKKITLLIMMLLIVTFGFSQQVLQDFESEKNVEFSDIYGAFGGGLTASLAADPTDASNQAGKIEEVSGGDVWKGIFVRPQTNYIDLTSSQVVSIDVYATSTTYFTGIVQDGQSNQATIELNSAVEHTGTGWETLTFTFTGASGEWGEFAMRVNVDASGNLVNPATEVITTYVDNLTAPQGSAITVPPQPSTAAPLPPSRNSSDVISIFSDAYTDITVDTFDTDWCPGETVELMIEGNATKRISGLGCEGIDWQSARTVDASGMTHFHMDIWTESETLDKSFNMKFSNWAGGTAEANAIEFSATNASNPALPNPNPGTWISFDIPLTSFTEIDGSSISDIVQFVITSNLGTVYYDNLYLYSDTSLSNDSFSKAEFKSYPNPTQDVWTIKTTENIQTVQVFNVTGRLVKDLKVNASEVMINANDLASGIYLAKISNEFDQTKTIKLIKE